LNGDGTITARVISMSDTNGWAKAGLMIRQSLDASAANVFAAITPEFHGVVAQYRDQLGNTTSQLPGPAVNAPYWLRLTRTGNTFTAAASSDGTTWTTYATINNVAMNSSTLVGLAVTSHNDGALCTAQFDSIAITTSSSSSSPPPPSSPPAPPPTSEPSNWNYSDIGNVNLPGSNVASGNTITIKGAGADIWDTADSFHFVSKPWTGDGVVEAQVSSMDSANDWAKAGVMIRDSLRADAPNVCVALTPSWHGIVAQARTAAGATTAQTAGPARNAPYWIRIVRSGNTFTAATSADGTTWTPFATFTVSLSSTAYFGFAVTSHDTSRLETAVFTDPFVGAP